MKQSALSGMYIRYDIKRARGNK